MKHPAKLLLIILSFVLPCTLTYAQQDWSSWVQELRTDAIRDGINPEVFDVVFFGLTPNPRVLHLDRTQPEHRITFLQYRKTRIDPLRIKLGIAEYKKRREVLEKIGDDFGVDPCFIVAFWGIESSYGRYMGDFSVIRSLATLAYDDRRGESFRHELLIALHILNEGHIDNEHFKGEWAGASGQPQFMPSSWQKYAVDYEGTGKKDIWRSYPDAFASIANYLRKNGWHKGEPWAIQVDLPSGFNQSFLGLNQTKPVYEWLRMGVRPIYGDVMPNENLSASIVEPEGGPVFMVFNNFRVIMTYNNSIFYAGSVGYLADQISKNTRSNIW